MIRRRASRAGRVRRYSLPEDMTAYFGEWVGRETHRARAVPLRIALHAAATT